LPNFGLLFQPGEVGSTFLRNSCDLQTEGKEEAVLFTVTAVLTSKLAIQEGCEELGRVRDLRQDLLIIL
jgi:hypothetical protein